MSDFEDRLRGELQDLAAGAEPPPTLAQSIDNRLGAPPARRPPVALLALAAAIVLTAVSVAILSTQGNGGSHQILLTSGASTTTPSTISLGVFPGLPGNTPPVSDTTTAATAATAPPATTAVNPTTTTLKSTTTAPTTTVALTDCLPSQLQASTATDLPTYPMGTPVTIKVTVANVSATRCQIQNPLANPFQDAVKITGSSGVVWQPRSTMNGVAIQRPPQVLAPQQSYTWATVQWNQHRCVDPCTGTGGGQVVMGTYTAVPLNTPGPASSGSFTIF